MPPSKSLHADTFDLSEMATIKVIVVPVGHQKKDSFQSHFSHFQKYSTLSLAELTPPDSKTAKYSEEFYHDGCIHFEFVTSYNKDLAQLEEIEISRQILGVIGVLNCQEVDDLHEGYRYFQQIVQRYPTSLAHRCFAFEPKADQSDDTKGVIMIPNVGDIGFYLQTMVGDFTADLLLALSLMAGQLERKTLVQGPVIISPFFTSAGDSAPLENGIPSQVLVSAQGNGISTPSSIPKIMEGDQHTPSSGTPTIMSSLNNNEKSKKRSPARVHKLMADLYLLAGRIELALQSFVSAIELCKLNNDLQWQASASEGYLCAKLLLIMKEETTNQESQRLLSSREIMELCNTSKKMSDFVCELPERYREIVSLYDKSHPYGVYGYYPILQIQTSLRIANFLSFVFLDSFKGTFINCAGIPWSYEGKSLTAELTLRMASTTGTLQPGSSHANSVTNTLIPQQSSSQVEKAILQNGTGVTKLDIMTWITRISLTGNEYLTPKDYLTVLSAICSICKRINAFRKYAFYLRLVGTVSRYLGSKQQSQSENVAYSLKSWSLAAMHKVSDILESPSKNTNDDDTWLETYGTLVSSKADVLNNLPRSPPSYCFSLRYGWPNLRIGILKEAILLSDSDKDHINTIIFTAKLLRKLLRHLSRKEQKYFSDLLLRVVLQHRKQLAAEPEKTPLIKIEDGVVLGVPLVLKMEVIPSTSRYSATQHNPKLQVTIGKADTFLYSPFAKKKTEQKELFFAANEMVHVDVTLSNPFMFEIDVQAMSLSGTNLPMKPLIISTLIPAETRAHIVRLSCIPLESGVLHLSGITLRMLGGCIEETVIPLERYLTNELKFTPEKKLRKQSDQDRAGKKILDFIETKKKRESLVEKPWSIPISVINSQPVLELLETSLGSHQAITLFEGERSSLSFTIRNIGNRPINYIFMRIIDLTVSNNADDSPMSPYETEVYQTRIRAFYPLASVTTPVELSANTGAISQMTHIGELQPIKLDQELQPGDQMKIPLGVFGRKNCTGGQIQISYGYLTEAGSSEMFFTRELSVSFLLTVIPALSFRNPDVLHYSSSATPSDSPSLMAVAERSLSVEEIMMNPRLSTTINDSIDESNTFILTFDLRNEWDEPFKVTFDIYNDLNSHLPTSSSTTILHAGVTKRIILPIARYLLSKSKIQEPIPTPAGKQFVVSKLESNLPEGMARALFWYREELIGGLSCRGRLVLRWSCSHNRNGVIPFREFEFLPRYIPVVKSDSILIDGEYLESETVIKTGLNSYQCSNHNYAILRWHVTNHLENDVHLIFRACPVQDTPTGIASFHSFNDIIFIGSSNRLLDPIKVGETVSFDMPVMFSATGVFKLIAHVEKIQEKKVVVKKSKYEVPDVILEDIETIHWFKSGVFINVID